MDISIFLFLNPVFASYGHSATIATKQTAKCLRFIFCFVVRSSSLLQNFLDFIKNFLCDDWLEPFQNWIKVASNLVKIARDSNLFEKKVAAKQVFGSNLRLAAREARGNPQNQRAALCAAHEMAGQKSESQILEPPVGLEPTTCGLQNRRSTN